MAERLTVLILLSTLIWSILFQFSLFFIFILFLVAYYFLSEKVNPNLPNMSLTKKILLHSCRKPAENRYFVNIQIDLTAADSFLKEYNAKNPESRLTYSHIALKAVAEGMNAGENICGKLSFGNLVQSKTTDIGLLVSIEGKNLMPYTVRDCYNQGMEALGKNVKRAVRRFKEKKDKDNNIAIQRISKLNTSMTDILLHLNVFLVYNMDMNLAKAKFYRDHYGFGVISNLGNFGIHNVYGSAAHLTRCNMLTIMCSPRKMPVVVKGKPEVRKVFNWSMNLDRRVHNLVDVKELADKVKEVWANPQNYL